MNKRTISILALGSLLGFIGFAREPAIPADVHALLKSRKRPWFLKVALVTSNWTVWTTADVVPKTRQNVAPTYTYHHVLQARGEIALTVAPFEYRSTRPMRPLWVFEDGTLVLFRAYPAATLVVEPTGTVHTNRIHDVRLNTSDSRPDPLLAADDGAVMQPWSLNRMESIFLVPWKQDRTGLDFAQSRQIFTDALPVNMMNPQSRIRWFGDTILVWAHPGTILTYSVASGQKVSVSTGAKLYGGFGATDGTSIVVSTKDGSRILHIPTGELTQFYSHISAVALVGDLVCSLRNRDGKRELYVWDMASRDKNAVLDLGRETEEQRIECFQEGSHVVVLLGETYKRIRIDGGTQPEN